MTTQVSTDVQSDLLSPSSGEEPEDTDSRDIHLDRTLVLIGCGKQKRDPDDPVDVNEATVKPGEPLRGECGPTGPAWPAGQLYASSYFAAKRAFAKRVSRWTGEETTGWAILSAEHGVLEPWMDVAPYDTSVADLGEDPTEPEHRVPNPFGRRRPDGREIVTETDAWSARVAYSLCKWLASYRDGAGPPWECDAETLLVLAGQTYLEPLRERGVFEYGISRMAGNPNEVWELPVDVRYLFEEIDAGGVGEQMAWLSETVDRLGDHAYDGRAQAEVGQYTGNERQCDHCGTSGPGASLTAVGGGVYCPDCHPKQCARCEEWTHGNGLGGYPLCEHCQTERGGQKREPLETDATEQLAIDAVATATDGGEQP